MREPVCDVVAKKILRDDVRRLGGALGEALREIDGLYRILEDLTPGGSEFYHDAERCAEYIRQKQRSDFESIKRFKLRADYERRHRKYALKQARAYQHGTRQLITAAHELAAKIAKTGEVLGRPAK
jgi:hypothetical protein